MDATISCTDAHVLAVFPRPRPALSSAVLGGGLETVSGVLNLKVSSNYLGEEDDFPNPALTLAAKGAELGLAPPFIGMMTAASMRSLRCVELCASKVKIAALATTGLSNARRAGDPADWRPFSPGTINTVLLIDAALTPAAMLEAAVVATEAKCAALQDLGAVSTLTGSLATGTGTDSLAVVADAGPELHCYCGKHTLLGEMIGRAVIEAVGASLDRRPASSYG